MAFCENCNKPVPAENIVVAARGEEKILVGPCCLGAPIQPPQFEYHLEFSSTNGAVATFKYADLTLQFRKSPQQLQQLYSKYSGQQATEETAHVTH